MLEDNKNDCCSCRYYRRLFPTASFFNCFYPKNVYNRSGRKGRIRKLKLDYWERNRYNDCQNYEYGGRGIRLFWRSLDWLLIVLILGVIIFLFSFLFKN